MVLIFVNNIIIIRMELLFMEVQPRTEMD